MEKKIKCMRVLREVKSAGNEAKQTLALLRELNPAQQVTREVHYSEGEEEQVTEAVYNEEGLLVSEEVHYLVDDVREKLQIEYNAAGKRAKETKSYNNEVQEVITREYDARNNPVSSTICDSEGGMEEKEVVEFNEQDKPVSLHKYGSDNELLLKSFFTYSDDGELAGEERWSEESGDMKIVFDVVLKNKPSDSTAFDKDGKILHRVRHTYDEKEQLVKEVVESTVGGLQKWINQYTYNEAGKVIDITVLDKSETKRKQTQYLYNEENQLIAEVLYEEVPYSAPVQVKLSYEYEYYED